MYEVQHYTLCNGWVNGWETFDDIEGKHPRTFETVEEAQAELDEFFNDVHTDILNGDRGCDDNYCHDDFMIVEIKEPVALAA